MRRSVVGLVVGSVCALGCGGSSFQNRVPDVPLTPERMVLLPVVVKTYELDASSERTEQQDATIQSNVDSAVRAQVAAHGIRIFAHDLDDQDQSVKALYARLWGWLPKASTQIAAQKSGRIDLDLHSVADWRFPGNLAPLGSVLQADTALAVFVSDTRETKGRSVLMGLGGMRTYWKKIGTACVVSLHDGRMVWCDSRIDAWGDLKIPSVANALVGQLLGSLLTPGAARGPR